MFFNQASLLSTFFYHSQIFMHRPLLAMGPRQRANGLSPEYNSLAVCTNAAHCNADVMEVQTRRSTIGFFIEVVRVSKLLPPYL
jgi:hypothetical protein